MIESTAKNRPFRSLNRDTVAQLVEACRAEMFDDIRSGRTPAESVEWGWFHASMELKYRNADELARRAARPSA